MMFCSKCGNSIGQNDIYCNKCGNFLKLMTNNNEIINRNLNSAPTNSANNIVNNELNTIPSTTVNNELNTIPSTTVNNNSNTIPNDNFNQFRNNIENNNDLQKRNNKKNLFIGIGVGLGSLFVIAILFTVINGSSKYFFSDNSYENNENIETVGNETGNQTKSKYSTIIITDNTYSGVKINDEKDAYQLISKDSISQKNKCPNGIKKIEKEIIDSYGITAVNLCEMDINFAKEVSKVFKKIYDDYPNVRENLTNLSLVNASMSEGYIAAFMPMFSFATSNSSSTYPWVIKTQVLLNTTYFLNTNRLDSSIKEASKVGHFPPNATMYSPVAHELGHYLSFLALMRNNQLKSILLINNNNISKFYDVYGDFVDGSFSLQMIKEAYEKYKKEIGTTQTIDEWRASISRYAVAKDNSGKYIYDETIAEAFHDVYLNEEKAKDASKYIVTILKQKLGVSL